MDVHLTLDVVWTLCVHDSYLLCVIFICVCVAMSRHDLSFLLPVFIFVLLQWYLNLYFYLYLCLYCNVQAWPLLLPPCICIWNHIFKVMIFVVVFVFVFVLKCPDMTSPSASLYLYLYLYCYCNDICICICICICVSIEMSRHDLSFRLPVFAFSLHPVLLSQSLIVPRQASSSHCILQKERWWHCLIVLSSHCCYESWTTLLVSSTDCYLDLLLILFKSHPNPQCSTNVFEAKFHLL